MLRKFRVLGAIFCIVLAVFSFREIQQLYETGMLIEEYPSQRAMDITLFLFSLLGIGAFVYLEVLQGKSQKHHHHLTSLSRRRKRKQKPIESNITTIYSSLGKADPWDGSKIHTHRMETKTQMDKKEYWLLFLRVLSFSFCIFYAAILFLFPSNRMDWSFFSDKLLMVYAWGGSMLILSIVLTTGMIKRKAWSLKLGYTFSFFHFLLFPIGTAFALFFVIGLVGVGALLEPSSKEKRRKARNSRL